MDQMDEELAQTSIGESFEKVNMFLISSIAVLLSCGLVKLKLQPVLKEPNCAQTNQTRGKNV